MATSKRAALLLVLLLAAAFAGGASPVAAAEGSRTFYGPVSYSWTPTSDFWTCSGFRLAEGSVTQDHFTCTIVDQTFSGTFSETKAFPCGCSGWASDYDGLLATSYLIKVAPNGLVIGTATY